MNVEQTGAGAPPPKPRKAVALREASPQQIAQLRDTGQFFWLHLTDGSAAELEGLGAAMDLHPLTIEDLEHFDQRAKVEDYENYVYLVAYGAAPPDDVDRLVEVHIVYSAEFLLTVTSDASNELRAMHEQLAGTDLAGQKLLHGVLDVLVDSFAPLLDEIDDEIEQIEDRIFTHRPGARENEIHAVRRRLTGVVRVAHRQSEAFTRLREMLSRLPEQSTEQAPYFRDVQDHLIRVTESADSLRDRLQGVFEIYLATIDNRQSSIMKQFTVIAGVFLPLNVLVGFFGMNFGWMVGHITAGATFAVLGVALPAVIIVGLLVLSWRRGFLFDRPTAAQTRR